MNVRIYVEGGGINHATKASCREGFLGIALHPQANVEAISKSDLMERLLSATRNTRTKGAYHKTRHAFDLLARINPDKVRRASPHAERLCSILLDNSSA